MKWIDMPQKKFLRLTYCMINGISWIVRMIQERSWITSQSWIWRAPEAWTHIPILNEKAKLSHFHVHQSAFSKCHMIHYDRSSTAYLPMTFSNTTVYMIFNYLCQSMRHGLVVCGSVGTFAPIWSKFRCTGTSTLGQQTLQLCHEFPDRCTQYRLGSLYAKWDSQICSDRLVIMICAQDSLLHRTIDGISSCLINNCVFANLICQWKQTRRYWVTASGYLWHSRSICWPVVEVLVHQRILGVSSWQIQHCIFANPIWQSTQSRRYWVLVS